MRLTSFAVQWRERVGSFFFGRDVFLSYRRSDSLAYAEGLFRALGARGLTVYGDWRAALPGEGLPDETIRALKRCRLLVVVGTPDALQSEAIAQEIEIWTATRKPIVPVDVGGALEQAGHDGALWRGVMGAPRVPESSEVLLKPRPSPSDEVVARIEDCATFVRQERRLRTTIFATMTIVASLLMAGIGAGWWIARTTQRQMNAATRRAAQMQRAAEDAATTAAEQRKLASDAEAARASADKARANAIVAVGVAAAEVQRQERIGAALRSAHESSAILRQQPQLVFDAAVLAIRSVRELHSLGVRSFSADSAIRDISTLVPEVTRQVRYPANRIEPVVTPDGRFVAVVGKRSVTVFDLTTAGSREFEFPSDARKIESIAISANGSRVVVVFERYLTGSYLRVWPGSVEIAAGFNFDAVALSHDGAHLAMITMLGRPLGMVGPPLGDLVEVFDTTDGKRIAATLWPLGIYKLAFSRSGSVLALSGFHCDGVWSWREDKRYFVPLNVGEIVLSPLDEIVLSPLDENLVATSHGEWVCIWAWRRWNDTDAKPQWRAPFYFAHDIGFSNDGAKLSVVTGTGQARIVRFYTMPPSRPLNKPLETNTSTFPSIRSLAIADSFMVLTANDRTTRLYHGDLHNHREIGRMAVEPESIAVDSDGNATIVSREGAQRWRGRARTWFWGINNGPYAISADLQTVVDTSRGYDSRMFTIKTQEASGGYQPREYGSTSSDVTALALSPINQVLVGTADGLVHVWPRPLNEKHTTREIDQSATVNAIEVAASGRRVAIAAGTNVRLCELTNGALRHRLTIPHPAPVKRLAFLGDHDDRIATVCEDKQIRVWRIRQNDATLMRTYTADRVVDVALGGNRYLTVLMPDEIAIWDVESRNGAPVRIPAQDATTIAFDPWATLLAVAGRGRIVFVWAWQKDAAIVARIPSSESSIRAVRFSRDGSELSIFGFGTEIVPSSGVAIAHDLCRRLAIADRSAFKRACSQADLPH